MGKFEEAGRPLLGLMSVGFVLVACIFLGFFLGSWLDRRLSTGPWLMVAGVGLGTAAGFVQLFRSVNKIVK